jgi:SLT domain-containing protein
MPINTILNLVSSLLDLATKILPDALKTIVKVIETIASAIDTIFTAIKNSDGPTDFFKELHKLLDPETAAREEYIKQLDEEIAATKAETENIKSYRRALEVANEQISKGKWYSPAPSNMSHISGYSSMSHYAQGGLVTAPSICGEAGPELVIPLDNSRAGRASQIINNYNTTQSFNMQSNQSTPLAFSQAIGQNRFIKRFAGV